MAKKPPSWENLFTPELFGKIGNSPIMREIISRAQREYVYWDKFKYYNFPKDITAEQAWAFLKITRLSAEVTPIKSIDGKNFTYNTPKTLWQKLNFIDTHGAGLIKSFNDKPSEIQVSKYIISGLTEEAIASSQIEGANTTHKVAKEMILSERKPRTKDEQMIVNNYRAMQKLEEWKDLDLTEQMLLDLQAILIDQTVEENEKGIVGRFRIDADNIVVHDPLTGEIAHTPPKESIMHIDLKKLIEYANQNDTEEGDFTHPVVKATILHFWFAYLHPFVDGNGRSSRALFYWYLLKKNYWLIQYISVSRAIKNSRKKYDNAFLYSEHDDNDLTYFLLYIVGAFQESIVQFLEYFERKSKEAREIKKSSALLEKFNFRQVTLLKYFIDHMDGYTDVVTHQNKHGIGRITANNDLSYLVQKGYIRSVRKGRKFIYMPNLSKIKSAFSKK